MVLFAKDGDEVSITADRDAKSSLDVLLIAGLPLNEPIGMVGWDPLTSRLSYKSREAILKNLSLSLQGLSQVSC